MVSRWFAGRVCVPVCACVCLRVPACLSVCALGFFKPGTGLFFSVSREPEKATRGIFFFCLRHSSRSRARERAS